MTEITNQQEHSDIDVSMVSQFVESAIKMIAETNGKTPDIAFVSDTKMRALNKRFRNKDKTTDILSFPAVNEPFEETAELGELVISVEQATRQASENGLDLETEIKQLVLHGILHLCGMDHDTDSGEMAKKELGLREQLAIA